MIDTIHEIVSYLVFIILLATAANTTKDSQSYPFYRSLSATFLAQGEPTFDEVIK